MLHFPRRSGEEMKTYIKKHQKVVYIAKIVVWQQQQQQQHIHRKGFKSFISYDKES